MPSRSSPISKTNSKQPKMSNESRKLVKQKLLIAVTKDSQPKDILSSSWEFLSVYQFFDTFRSYFQLATSFSIEKLEDMLLETDQQDPKEDDQFTRESSVTSTSSTTTNRLSKFMIQIISPLLSAQRKKIINESNYQDILQKLFPHTAKFSELNMLEKIKILKRIGEAYSESTDEQFLAAKDEKTPEELRLDPLGTDYEGWTYWYFGGTRLYREIPLPSQGSYKKSADWMNSTDFSFDLVCSTAEEWHDMVKKFQPSNRSSSKELASTVCEIGLEAIRILDARETARLRREAKIERAKKVELLPKKRSSRLEVKHVEEAKKQKLIETERQQVELEKYERKQKVKEAKEAAEKDKRDLRIEEARLKNNIHAYISSLISNGQGDETKLKELRTMISARVSKEELVTKMQGWIELLGDRISFQITDQNAIRFTSDNPQEVFESVLFKSVFRYYIVTIRQYQLEPTSQAYEQLGSVYTKFILNRYENLEAFCFDLNNVFATWFDTEALGHAIGLLRLIYASQSANTIVSKEHLVEKSAAALEKIVPENTSLEPSTTHDTPLELHP